MESKLTSGLGADYAGGNSGEINAGTAQAGSGRVKPTGGSRASQFQVFNNHSDCTMRSLNNIQEIVVNEKEQRRLSQAIRFA
eukprot:2819929-Rhodomonas_salina.1